MLKSDGPWASHETLLPAHSTSCETTGSNPTRTANAEKTRRFRAKNKEHVIRFGIEMDREEHAELKAMAKKQNTSIVGLIQNYITWGLENDA